MQSADKTVARKRTSRHKRHRSALLGYERDQLELSTSIAPLNQLDDLIKEAQNRFGPTAREMRELVTNNEAQEIETLGKIIGNIKGRRDITEMVNMLAATQSLAVSATIFKFFLEYLTDPFKFLYEDGAVSPSFLLVIESVDRVLMYFNEEQQSQILKCLASLPLTMAPEPPGKTKKVTPPFAAYEAAAGSCVSVLKKCLSEGSTISHSVTASFVKKVISNVIITATHLSMEAEEDAKPKPEMKRSQTVYGSKVDLKLRPVNTNYIGAMLPFMAELGPILSKEDDELTRLLQQFWIASVLISNSFTQTFKNWSDAMDIVVRFMPPLFQRGTRIEFAPVRMRVKELMVSMKMGDLVLQPAAATSYLVQKFNALLPNVPARTIQTMDAADRVYALSIYYLEVTRAERGIVDQIFDYTDVNYTKEFSVILDAMLDPIFDSFKKYLDAMMANEEKRYTCLGITFASMVEKFFSPSVRIQNAIDKYIEGFASVFPAAVCCKAVLRQIISNAENISNLTEVRQQIYNKMLSQMVRRAIKEMPYSFAAVLYNCISNEHVNFTHVSVPLMKIVKWLDSHSSFRDNFMSDLVTKSIVSGQADYITVEQIEQIKNPNDRVLLLAFYIVQHKRMDLIEKLFVQADPKALLTAWFHVASKSMKMSKRIVSLCITTFLASQKAKLGVFGSERDMNEIKFQNTMLIFLIEQQLLNKHATDIVYIISSALDVTFLKDAAVVPVLLHYAELTSLVLANSPFMCDRMIFNMRRFLIKACLIAVSYTYDNFVFRYVGVDEIHTLMYLIEVITKVTQDKQPANNDVSTGSRSGSISLSATIPSTASTRFDGKITKTLEQAFARDRSNFMASHGNEAIVLPAVIRVVQYLLCDQLQVFHSFIGNSNDIVALLATNQVKPKKHILEDAIPYIWEIAPEVLYMFTQMNKIGDRVAMNVREQEQNDVYTAATIPELALLFARLSPTSESKEWDRVKEDKEWLKLRDTGLPFWRPLPAAKALTLLRPEIMANKASAEYVVKCFSGFTRDESLLFLPQLVQSLRFDKLGILRAFLISYCKQSEVFCHYLLWNIATEKENYIGKTDNLPGILQEMETEIISKMDETEKTNQQSEFGLIKTINDISAELLPMAIDKRPMKLVDRLNEVTLSDNLYIPSNPNYRIVSIDAEHSVPLKSHARVPVLIHFSVYDEKDPEKKPFPFSCIFKIADDVRQDAMVIQFIDTCKHIFDEAGLDTWLLPYRVFATGNNEGVIECIQHATSRHDLGKATNEMLDVYFVNKYGQVNTEAYQKALDNFIKSVAPYSIICYLFQVKDRHNANIMIDEDGHIIHIDFGFIFEISPGGNMKFERAPFRLNSEMINLLGGSKEAAPFVRFRNLLVKCFLAVRARHEELEAVATLMMNCGFPCFRADSIKKLQQRLFLDKSLKAVVESVDGLIDESYMAVSTDMYDAFQSAQNQIYF